jgi:pSer/pThr/pTyr-binding forkhead associated (FHA) protein
MELIVLGMTGALLLVGTVSGAQAFRRWLRSRRAQLRYRRGIDEIPIVFPKESRAPAGMRAGLPSHEMDVELPSRSGPPLAVPQMDLELPGDGAASLSRIPLPLDLPEALTQNQPSTSLDPETASEWENAIEGSMVRYHRTDARTMRLLPGRLEVEEGEDGRTEIRFVDSPGGKVEVTFGRRSGEPFRHVQLRSPTVSREHARMTRTNADWLIENLSETNPILVNGTPLQVADRLTLKDGDRVEMGEVVFRYRYP